MTQKLTTACITLIAFLLTAANTHAHPGHPGHEYWPFDDFKMAALVGTPLIVLGAVMLFRKFRRS